jgi:hypothetical protein
MEREHQYETDEERMEHHASVNHELQAVIDTVAKAHLGDTKASIMAALEREFTAAGHWPQPKRWIEAIAEDMEAGHTYHVTTS